MSLAQCRFELVDVLAQLGHGVPRVGGAGFGSGVAGGKESEAGTEAGEVHARTVWPATGARLYGPNVNCVGGAGVVRSFNASGFSIGFCIANQHSVLGPSRSPLHASP